MQLYLKEFKFFLIRTAEYKLNIGCVALLYVRLSNDQNDEVSDTTGDAKKNKSW
jgi:hypothetical protein